MYRFRGVSARRCIDFIRRSGGRNEATTLPFSMLSYSGLSPTYFTANDTTVLFVTGVPPIRTIGGVEYLLVEGNDMTLNAYFENAQSNYGVKIGTTVGSNAATDPIYNVAADKMEETNTTGNHRLTTTFSVVSGLKYYFSTCVKNVERLETRHILNNTGFVGSPTINVINGTYSASASINWYKIAQVGNGFYIIIIGATSDLTTGSSGCSIYLRDNVSAESYTGIVGYGVLLAYDNVVQKEFPRSIIEADGSPGTFMGHEPMFYESDIPAWIRDGFEFDIIPEWSTAQAADYGDHLYLFSIPATAGSMDCYFDGADNKIHLDVGGFEQAITSALTWSMDQKITIRVQFDDGANSSIIVSGATAGNGTYTGTQCAAADGDLAWGMRHTTNDLQGYIRISRPRKL